MTNCDAAVVAAEEMPFLLLDFVTRLVDLRLVLASFLFFFIADRELETAVDEVEDALSLIMPRLLAVIPSPIILELDAPGEAIGGIECISNTPVGLTGV